jgi:hypothetical protein
MAEIIWDDEPLSIPVTEMCEEDTWWLWLSILETQDIDILLYAALLPNTAKFPANTDDDKGELDTGLGKVTYFSKIVSNNNTQKFLKEIDKDSVLNFYILDSSIDKEFSISATREIIGETFGKSVVPIKSYYTTPDVKIFSDNLDDLKNILLLLKNETNLPFDKEYARRFGNFEMHDLSIAMDNSISVELLNSKRSKQDGAYIRVAKTPPLLDEFQKLHVICREKKDIIFQKLVPLEKGVSVTELSDLPEDSYELECWIFDESGEVIFQDHQFYIAAIGMNMAMIGRQIILKDKLTDRANKSDKKLGDSAASVKRTNTNRSIIQSKTTHEYKNFDGQMAQIQSDLFHGEGFDKWFGRSIECEIDVIKHFQDILCGGRAKKAILADPFFGSEAFERFVTRVEESTLELTILTSLSEKNPDTGEKFPTGSNPIDELKNSIRKVKELVNCNLRVVNINRGSATQAFHDRYLVAYPFDELPVVYMLSNSINKMSGNWPFCMSKLEPAIARHVREYIELLCEGKDNSRDGDPNITYEWPESEKPSN